uniref:Uncharacterized protein n=1 Tax=Macrostomum lignano TaxID=282301 RepID=A0A1I8IYG5_9PLAT
MHRKSRSGLLSTKCLHLKRLMMLLIQARANTKQKQTPEKITMIKINILIQLLIVDKVLHTSDTSSRLIISIKLVQMNRWTTPFPVEEIMPRRRSSGRRQRDAMVAAALRQLDSDDARGTAGDAPAERSSPYHSYQRIHHDRRGRYGDDIDAMAGGSSSSNGNVFQDSFNVSRVNPAYYWRE